LIRPLELRIRGCHPLWPIFPDRSSHSPGSAGPRSLAATDGVSVDFLSSGYLDVSVPRVRFLNPMYSGPGYLSDPADDRLAAINNRISGGLPHSEIHGSKPVHGSPWLIAVYHVLHRLLLPRHPPNALIALDPTRKEQGSLRMRKFVRSRPSRAGSHGKDMVSVLDLDGIAPVRPRLAPTPDRPSHTRKDRCNTDVISLYDVKSPSGTGRSAAPSRMLPMIWFLDARRPQPAHRNGGAYRDRTGDLMLAKHALSQLS